MCSTQAQTQIQPRAEPQSLRAPVSPHLGTAAVVVSCLFLLLTAGFFWFAWNAYASADESVSALATFRATLAAMEKVSAERGPTNSVLGEALPVPAATLEALRTARRNTDAAIDHLSIQLAATQCSWCAAEQLTLSHVTADLSAARANIDRLAQMPLAQRDDPSLRDAVDRMVSLVPPFTRIADASELDVVDGDTGVLDLLQMARFAAMLRDQAGLLGSRFTSAFASHRPLNQAEQLAVERSYGEVNQLHLAIASLAATNPALTRGAFTRVRDQYFSRGLGYVASVRALAGGASSPMPTTTQFANQYVPMMQPIIDFRDEMLARAASALQRHRRAMLAKCIATAAIGAILVVVQFLLVWLFRRYVVMPFTEATRAIIAIAGGDLPGTVQSRAYRGEVQSLFDAVCVLRTTSRERMRLEQERRALIAELTTMAETDALTGLLNRRAFESRARVLCSISGSMDSFISLISFDIDHFKRINDTYGHPTGDLALKKVGAICRETWRRDDIVARIGGEEFAVLIETQDPEEALKTVSRFREKLSVAAIEPPEGASFTFTASFGVAFSKRGKLLDMSTLVALADELLYRAKTGGRNRVEADMPQVS